MDEPKHPPGYLTPNPFVPHSHADTALMETIQPRVTGFRTILANTYLISERDGRWILVDAGVPG